MHKVLQDFEQNFVSAKSLAARTRCRRSNWLRGNDIEIADTDDKF